MTYRYPLSPDGNFTDSILTVLKIIDKYHVVEMVNYFVDGINGMIYTGKVKVDFMTRYPK